MENPNGKLNNKGNIHIRDVARDTANRATCSDGIGQTHRRIE